MQLCGVRCWFLLASLVPGVREYTGPARQKTPFRMTRHLCGLRDVTAVAAASAQHYAVAGRRPQGSFAYAVTPLTPVTASLRMTVRGCGGYSAAGPIPGGYVGC